MSGLAKPSRETPLQQHSCIISIATQPGNCFWTRVADLTNGLQAFGRNLGRLRNTCLLFGVVVVLLVGIGDVACFKSATQRYDVEAEYLPFVRSATETGREALITYTVGIAAKALILDKDGKKLDKVSTRKAMMAAYKHLDDQGVSRDLLPAVLKTKTDAALKFQ